MEEGSKRTTKLQLWTSSPSSRIEVATITFTCNTHVHIFTIERRQFFLSRQLWICEEEDIQCRCEILQQFHSVFSLFGTAMCYCYFQQYILSSSQYISEAIHSIKIEQQQQSRSFLRKQYILNPSSACIHKFIVINK